MDKERFNFGEFKTIDGMRADEAFWAERVKAIRSAEASARVSRAKALLARVHDVDDVRLREDLHELFSELVFRVEALEYEQYLLGVSRGAR